MPVCENIKIAFKFGFGLPPKLSPHFCTNVSEWTRRQIGKVNPQNSICSATGDTGGYHVP